ncbi:hypothetical protein HUG17_7958 [Dermatophagoides farinae]|uniref:Protein kinase domain-containing protein n=1 Tax=Dermatophagoides farinae TaxID=6954 RepID=A0A9D4SG51_DERFA|nr:hypothetical protein HUG17_7958 [Dermatophagoides farinae]
MVPIFMVTNSENDDVQTREPSLINQRLSSSNNSSDGDNGGPTTPISALVRTISNGSTFGPIPNWPSNDSSPSSSYNTVNPFYKIFHIHPNQPGWKPSSSSATSPNVSTPAQINVPIKLNLPLIFGDNYVLTSQIEASNLYRCLELNTAEEFWCKVVLSKNYYDFLAPHLRMDGHTGINQVQKIIIGRVHSFILFSPSFGDLHSYVRNKRRLRENEAMPLFRQIVEIVADCHRNGIILRDLKLRKFIFSNKERTQLKLETLEGASLFDDDDTLTDKHGCPAYVSPEILLSNSFSGLAADCWGMGVILYTMLVGRYPFHDVNPSSVFCKIRRGSYYIPDHLSKHGKCLIRSLMRMDPDERLTADDTLAHRWFDSFRPSILMNNSIMMKRNSTTSIATVPPSSGETTNGEDDYNKYETS